MKLTKYFKYYKYLSHLSFSILIGCSFLILSSGCTLGEDSINGSLDYPEFDKVTLTMSPLSSLSLIEDQGFGTIELALSGPAPRKITIDWIILGPSNTSEDFNQTSGQLTIAKGQSGTALIILLINDEIYEPEKLFTFVIQETTGAVTMSSSSLEFVLSDDDGEHPVAANISPTAFDEDIESIITLSYVDSEGDSATSCSLSALTEVNESTDCICLAGMCTVGVTGSANYNGPASFNYSVTANGQVSNSSSASLTISAVADLPISADFSPPSFVENVESIVSLVYSDGDGDQATACSISSLNYVTESTACSCTTGTCTVGVTSWLDYDGTDSFRFTVTANGQISNSSLVSLTITGVNQLPVVTSSPCTEIWAEGAAYNCIPTATDAEQQSLIWSFDESHTCGGWLSINSDDGVISGTPSVSNMGNCILAYNASDGSDDSIIQSTTLSVCPIGYIVAPELAGYTTQPFCVMKYEAKAERDLDQVIHTWGCDSDSVSTTGTLNCSGVANNWVQAYAQPSTPISVAFGRPWRMISRTEAELECRSLNSEVGPAIDTDINGDGTFDLINNNQWQSLARNIELLPINWSSGAIGIGELNSGHTATLPADFLMASMTDSDACFGTNQAVNPGFDDSCIGTWNTEKRTNELSNGQVIWDLGGNTQTLIKDTNSNNNNYGNAAYVYTITAVTHPSEFSLSGGPLRNAKDQFGPSGDYTNLSTGNRGGFGWAVPTGTGEAILRGGDYASQWNGGLFALHLNISTDYAGYDIGFRCSFVSPQTF